MLGLAALPLGERCTFLDPSPDAGAGHVGRLLTGAYDDPVMLEELARLACVVTYEFENVPAAAATKLASMVPTYPPPAALEAAQDRLNEKRLFARAGLATAPYVPASTEEELGAAVEELGVPVLAKTRREGYDGKGQLVIRDGRDVARTWETLAGAPLLVEGVVAFERELSILGVRGLSGEVSFYPLTENHHRKGILRHSTAPAPGLTPQLVHAAETGARSVMEELDYVGVIAIELFEKDGALVTNELAPRVHNSGHWTIEGAETSQFENHVRAILGLPLGSTAARGQSAMVNLIGALPDRAEVLAVAGSHLHLYGKSARPGRKVGHVTVCSNDLHEMEAGRDRLLRLAEDA